MIDEQGQKEKREEGRKKIRVLLSMCFITCRANEGERSSVNNCKAYLGFVAAAVPAARYTNQECVFLQMIKSIPF